MRDSSNLLRLRLVVRRHSLPEVRVVFAVQLDTDPTIANLLEQVNEIVPLESNDWGLEDYAVELRDSSGHAFDCVHFQPVSAILKDDEQVFIRPLDTGDRRKRRLSGREQISADGRHLIDGVAFGRPRLRTPRDRPPVDIPPLKRRRITYDAEEEAEDEQPRFLLTEHGENAKSDRRARRARFDDAEGDGSDGEEEDADDDFVDEDTDAEDEADRSIEDEAGESDLEDEAGGSDVEDELRDLQEDNEQCPETEPARPKVARERSQPSASASPARLDLATLDKISALRAAFPTVPADACERTLARVRGNTKLAYLRLQARHQPAMSLDAMLAHPDSPGPKVTAIEDATSDESEAESVASMVKHYDQHGFPSGSILAGTAAAQMAEAMRRSGLSVKPPVHTKFDDDATVPADQVPLPSSSNEEESASESDSDSGSESGSDSESGSGSDSDADSGPEIASSKIPQPSPGARISYRRGSSVSDASKSESEDESESDASTEDEDSSSGEEEDSDEDDSASSDSDGDGSFSDDSDDSNESAHREAGGSDSSEEADSSSDAESSDTSDDAVSEPRSPQKKDDTAMQSSAPQDKLVRDSQPKTMGQDANNHSTEFRRPVPPGQGKKSTHKRNARRRAAQKALRAAAHGEPTTPAAAPVAEPDSRELIESVAAKKEALLRRLGMMQGLISQDAKGSANNDHDEGAAASKPPRPEPPNPTDGTVNAQPAQPEGQSEDPEAWRRKISYRAVECCQDGIELSEPPFPFVQRWDPQQQYSYGDRNNRGGRSKRKQRNREEYLEDGNRDRTKRRKYGDSLGYDGDEESYANDTTGFEETILNYDDEPEETPAPPEPTPCQGEDEEDEEDDLPPLPADISTLPTLAPGEAVPGMILTWKQWLLSKATNWQPQVSALTGVVIDVLDEKTLRVRLAQRDRNLDRNEKVYDEDGNRVYDKFELPGMDDEGEDDDEQGYRTLELADMIEPRILRLSSGTVGTASSSKEPSGAEQQDAQRSAVQDNGLTRVSASPDETEAEAKVVDSHEPDFDPQGTGGPSMITETPVVREPVEVPAAEDVSEDLRHEISRMMDDAGFRKEVDPSVTDLTRRASLDLSSPSRQLEEMSYDVHLASSEAAQPQSRVSPELPSQATSTNLDSQLIHLEPFHGFSDPTSDPQDGEHARRVVYPTLEVPPSESSLHSGRQVDPDFSIELGTRDDSLHGVDDSAGVSRSTLGRHSDDEQDLTAGKLEHDSDARAKSPSSVSSFESLSDLWRSASTNGSRSPSKSAIMSALKARKSDVVPDLEYQEAMRRLDSSGNSSDEDEEEHPSKIAQKLVDKPIERPTPKKSAQKKEGLERSTAPYVKAERASPSPAPAARGAPGRSVRKSDSPFVIPEGSQVVELLTSSPEPQLEEYYAEDSIDETYEEPSGSSLPRGSGWVKKERVRRGVSMPPSSLARDVVPKRLASSQSAKQGQDKRTTSALASLQRARKKFASIL